jgi:putative endonuclease
MEAIGSTRNGTENEPRRRDGSGSARVGAAGNRAGRGDRGRRSLGRRGEDVAADYLADCGWQIITRNWRCRYGEVDVIARGRRIGNPIIFCEVKTRAGLGYGAPLEAITVAKMRRLRQLAGCWLAETGEHAARVRVDAIGVLILPGQQPQITHVEGAGG